MKKLLSRKFWMAISAIASLLTADYAATGTIHAGTITACAAIAVSYAVAQGWVDAKEKDNEA